MARKDFNSDQEYWEYLDLTEDPNEVILTWDDIA